MTYHMIINPVAGNGRIAPQLSALQAEAAARFPGIGFHFTRHPGHARELAAGLRERDALVIAVGGDGTVHEVVNGLVGGVACLGIIPAGNGNDFVSMLDLPSDIHAALSVIERAETLTIDIGRAGERCFPNMLGIGFDAEVVIESGKVRRLRGFMKYLLAVFRTLRHYRNRRVLVTIDGVREEREIFMITAGNGRRSGGGFLLTPEARLDDGLLDVCIFRGLTMPEILINLPRAAAGKHLGIPQVQWFRTRSLTVEAVTEGLPVHADGELLGTELTRIEITLLPGVLKVIHNLNPA